MPVTPFPFHSFGGLNLGAPDEIDGALDLLNVDWDSSLGSIRQRWGYSNLTGSAAAAAYKAPCVTPSKKILVARSTTLEALSSTGTSLATTALASASYPMSCVAFGSPSASYVYVGTYDAIKRWDDSASTFSSPAGGPKARLLTVQLPDNRLVAAGTASGANGPGGATSSESHVWFSNAGDAETWSSNDYVQLSPGDGEVFTGAVQWRGQVFVFKQTKGFVFYGNSVDASGGAVFNVRAFPLNTKIELSNTFSAAPVTAGRDAVYFTSNDGLYATTGDVPAKVSGDVALAWQGGWGKIPPYFAGYFANGGNLLGASYGLTYANERLFLSSVNSGAGGHLFYDLTLDAWGYWDLPGGALVGSLFGSEQALVLNRLDANHVAVLRSAFTTDAGADISSYYRTGFNDYGTDTEKTIRDAELWGTGTVRYSASADFDATLGTTEDVTLGTSPAIDHGFVHAPAASLKGTLFSHQFASVSGGAWAVHRCTQNVDGIRPPGMRGS